MNTEQILKVLRAERECIARQGTDSCDRNCANCSLVLPDTEILEVYDFLIKGYELLQNEGAESYMIKCTEPLSEDQLARFKEEWGKASFTASFEPIKPLPENLVTVVPDETAREIFHGICPYTNIKCEKWTCSTCKVEARERRFAKGDND